MKFKKVLAAVLAATLVMAPAASVCASEDPYAPSDEGYAPSTPSAPSSPDSSSEDSGSSVPAEIAETVKTAEEAVQVAGISVRTSVAGAYAAKSVQGAAVVTPLAEVKASLGLTGSQQPAITIYDTDPGKSPKALACVNAAAEALGAEVLTSLNIDLGAREDGKWVTLSDGSVGLTTGLPEGADTTKTYFAVCVQPGGVVTIFEDQDTNPLTVTFEVKAGIGTYAIVAQ